MSFVSRLGSWLARLTALESENATLQGQLSALEATIAAISELPTIRNLLDKATEIEAENEQLRVRVQELEETPPN